MTVKLPHVIYILSDEHCGFATSYMGDPNVRTPHIDRLLREGMGFRTAYTNTPICTPSRGTIFSGRYSHAGPVQHFFDVYKPTSPSTATLLREAGYHTAFFGKWHMGLVRDQMSPAVRANQEAYPWIEYFRRTPEYHRGGFQDWFAFELNDNPYHSTYYEGADIDPRPVPGYQTDGLTEMVLAYLAAYNREEPLFLVLSVEPPHFPLVAPPGGLRLDPADLQTRPNFSDTPQMRENLRTYYAMIENVDKNVGRLMAGLNQFSRFQDQTLTVYFSDHGEYMGSHGAFKRKEHPHEEGVRIPVVFHWPGHIPAKGLQPGLFSLVDMLPTTLGLLGLSVPAFIQGVDWSPACRSEPFAGPDAILIEINGNPRWGLDFIDWRAVVTAEWKYVFYETGHELLYNLRTDPYEQHNLVASHPHKREEMKQLLLRLLAETRESYFDVLINHGVWPEGPVINVSNRFRNGISPTWQELIITPDSSFSG